jgi:hypothetical protein
MSYEQSRDPHGAIIRTGQRVDQAPGPADPVPVAPSPHTNKSAWGQRADQGNGIPGAQLDKTLRHLDRRTVGTKPPRLYIGPIVQGPVRIPWAERR